MSIRKFGGKKSSKKSTSKKTHKSKRKSNAYSQMEKEYAKDVVTQFNNQLKVIDPIYVGSLGIRLKSYTLDQETKDVEMTFDSSTVIINGKQFRQKNWVNVTYDHSRDAYAVQGIHMKRNFDRLETKRATGMDAEQVYKYIRKITQM